MSEAVAAVLSTGIVSSVGLTAAATCAAVRAKLSNPSLTAFIDRAGKPIMAHQVQLDQPWRGVAKLAQMAAMAMDEALAGVPIGSRSQIALLLCVAERERPGRIDGLDSALFDELQGLASVQFAASSRIVSKGRVGVVSALSQACALIEQGDAQHVLVVGVDSLLTWGTLECLVEKNRLLTEDNSNGFMPGEGAGAILIGRPQPAVPGLTCLGLGFGVESATVDSEAPLRADGLAAAIKAALNEAGCHIDDVACRVTDLAGEQYYFKEATLALSRTLRQRRENLELWHPAESVGEVGAASGAMCVAVAHAAAAKRYLPSGGGTVLLHFSNDQGDRAAMVAGLGG